MMTASMSRVVTMVFIVMRLTDIIYKSHFTPATDPGEGTYVRNAIDRNVDVTLDTDTHSLLLEPIFTVFHCVGEAPEADEKVAYSGSQNLIRPMKFVVDALLCDINTIYSSLQHNIYSIQRIMLFASVTSEDVDWGYSSNGFLISLIYQHAGVLVLSWLRWLMSRSTSSHSVPPDTSGHSDVVLPKNVARLLPSRIVLAFSMIQALGAGLLQMTTLEAPSTRSLPHVLMPGIVNMASNIIASAIINVIVGELRRVVQNASFTKFTTAVVRMVYPVAKDFLDYSHAIHTSIAIESGNLIVALGIELGHLLFLQRQSLRWSAYLSWAGAIGRNIVVLLKAPTFCRSDEAIESKAKVSLDPKTNTDGPAEELGLALPFSWADDVDDWNEEFIGLVTKASRKLTRREKKQEKKRLARINLRAATWESLEITSVAMVSSDLTSVCFAPEMTSSPCSTSPMRSEAELRFLIGDFGGGRAT